MRNGPYSDPHNPLPLGPIEVTKTDKITSLQQISCCIFTDSPLGGFCAGGSPGNLRYKIKKYLEEIDHEYNGDNVILALWKLDYIDLNKIYKSDKKDTDNV